MPDALTVTLPAPADGGASPDPAEERVTPGLFTMTANGRLLTMIEDPDRREFRHGFLLPGRLSIAEWLAWNYGDCDGRRSPQAPLQPTRALERSRRLQPHLRDPGRRQPGGGVGGESREKFSGSVAVAAAALPGLVVATRLLAICLHRAVLEGAGSASGSFASALLSSSQASALRTPA